MMCDSENTGCFFIRSSKVSFLFFFSNCFCSCENEGTFSQQKIFLTVILPIRRRKIIKMVHPRAHSHVLCFRWFYRAPPSCSSLSVVFIPVGVVLTSSGRFLGIFIHQGCFCSLVLNILHVFSLIMLSDLTF